MMQDAFLESEMERQPQKFTMHCMGFLCSLFFVFFICKWLAIKLSLSKAQDSKLDIMMKRQIMESIAFKNCLQHYDKNICVQYASEEEYMAMMRLKEQ